MTRSTGVSWACMDLYSVLMLMPCFAVPKTSVHGYPMVRGGRFLASCVCVGEKIKYRDGERKGKKRKKMKHRKATATNAQLHLR